MKEQKTGKRPVILAATWCSVLAMLALAPLPGVVLLGAGKAVAADVDKANPNVTNKSSAADTGKGTGTATATGTPEEREAWRQKILKTPKPAQGCFEANYPDTTWHEVACGKPNGKLYPPRTGGGMSRIDQVGGNGGTDFSAQAANISQAEGSFDSVNGLTSESNSNGVKDSYSLQLNTNTYQNSKACSAAPDKSCTAWEQFVYDSSGSTQIQYWLINWGPQGQLCPTPRGASCAQGFVSSDGWCPQTVTGFTDVLCVVDAKNPPPASAEPATSLAQLKVTGFAGSGSTPDSMAMSVAGHVTTGNGDNYFTDLASNWQIAEFNVFGDSGDQANFNTGTTIEVRTQVDSGVSTGPTCDQKSFTGESNNLILVATNSNPPKSQFPSLVFTESNAAGSTLASCAQAVSLGDTHMTTFDGLHYDFQASGDFVLARDGSDFIVQARQASGAPTWPEAAVNKAVATQMGTTRVAVYIQPTRLVVDGTTRTLADGGTIKLPTGVVISRHGSLYLVAAENGDNVRAVLNSTWIDVTVGLGRAASRNTRGLLGNPNGDAHALATSAGVELKEPVPFNDLYHTYTDSWRVNANASLFNVVTTIKPGIPSKPFFAANLDPAAAARATATCKQAGVTNPDLLEDCALDTAVLNTPRAAKVFVHPPLLLRRVIKPTL